MIPVSWLRFPYLQALLLCKRRIFAVVVVRKLCSVMLIANGDDLASVDVLLCRKDDDISSKQPIGQRES